MIGSKNKTDLFLLRGIFSEFAFYSLLSSSTSNAKLQIKSKPDKIFGGKISLGAIFNAIFI